MQLPTRDQGRLIPPRRAALGAALVVVLATIGCEDVNAPSAPQPAGPSQTSTEGGAALERDLSAIPRFDVDLEAVGSFRVGAAIHITYSVTAKLDTRDAVITLRLPEVELARLSGWQPVSPRLNQRVASAREVRQPLAIEQRVGGQLTVIIPDAGYYRVVLVADAPGVPIVGPSGGFVGSTSVRELWLLVGARGGRATAEFDRSVFGDSLVPQPGPFRVRQGRTTKNGASPSAARASASSSDGISGYLLYYHQLNGQYIGIGEARMDIKVWDVAAQQYVWGYASATGPDGSWADGCPMSGYNHHIEFYLESSNKVYMEAPYAGTLTTSEWDCGRTDHNMYTDSNAGHVFVTLNRGADLSRSFFQRQRGWLNVRFRAEANSYYQKEQPWGPTGHADRITISTVGNPSHIWGAWGTFVQGHEYGHGVHHRALGDYPSLDSGCQDHAFNSTETMECAHVEGFADYHAVALFGAETGQQSPFENNSYYPGGDGSRIEGSVAAFLYDITDAANEGHDTIQLPGQYVGDVMSTCDVWVQSLGNWVHSRAIEHLVYCSENQIDPWIAQNNYFPTSWRPSAQRESATEPPGWSPGAIRALWLRNLYGQ
jgi:hypothetical protein